MSRSNEITMLFGSRNTGKTYHTHEIIAAVRKSRPRIKVVVMDTFDSPPYRKDYPERFGEEFTTVSPRDLVSAPAGLYRMFGSNFEEMFRAVDKLWNSFVVMEDARKYLPTPLPRVIQRILIDTKQKNVDMLMLFHNVMHAAPDLWSLADKVILHKCSGVSKRLDLVSDPDELNKAYTEVMKGKERWTWRAVRIN